MSPLCLPTDRLPTIAIFLCFGGEGISGDLKYLTMYFVRRKSKPQIRWHRFNEAEGALVRLHGSRQNRKLKEISGRDR
jgi:hypothetical protein